jgi:hypothetical protein
LLLAPLGQDGGDYQALIVSTEIERTARELELTVPADLSGPPRSARTERVANLRVLEATGVYQHFSLPLRDDGDAVGVPMMRDVETPIGA